MQAAYENVTAGLASYNATGDNPTSPTVVLTPTRFSNISRDVTDMATFHDAGSFYTCPIIFAMDKIQACEGVKTDTFTQLPNHYIQVILYYFKESRADMCWAKYINYVPKLYFYPNKPFFVILVSFLKENRFSQPNI